MRLLFEDSAKRLLTKDRLQRFEDWIGNVNIARDEKSLDPRTSQCDKAEELITFYTFAPLDLREDKKAIIQEILRLACVVVPLEGEINLRFERQFKPPEEYLAWLKNRVEKHPVKYIREQGKEHIKNGKRLETNTHVDFVLECQNLLILVEVKFTSDISTQTKFNVNRNQLARMIDVGIEEAEEKNKKLIVFLSSPSELCQRKSRLFCYKIQEYANFQGIKEDIGWRPLEKIRQHLLTIAWLPLEKVINVVYRDFTSPETNEAICFFKDRNLA